MSRVGKQPIIIPEKVSIKIDGNQVMVKGPKGELSMLVAPHVTITLSDKEAVVHIENEDNKKQRALWGTTRSNLQNLVSGVSEGFSKQLEINGVGYKAAVQGKKLVLNVGYSHPVEYDAPAGIEFAVEKNIISISGIDKQLLGKVAAEIRAVRKPEPYKGKGIKYIDEVIRRKAGKMAKGAEK
ncbi:MAG: 50S ribosomal protein L6 [Candidatus Komeilibacteria bacterium]